MRLRRHARITDERQIEMTFVAAIRWVKAAGGFAARTAVGLLRAVRLPWRWWDGYLDDRYVSSGFTAAELLAKLERLVRELEQAASPRVANA